MKHLGCQQDACEVFLSDGSEPMHAHHAGRDFLLDGHEVFIGRDLLHKDFASTPVNRRVSKVVWLSDGIKPRPKVSWRRSPIAVCRSSCAPSLILATLPPAFLPSFCVRISPFLLASNLSSLAPANSPGVCLSQSHMGLIWLEAEN